MVISSNQHQEIGDLKFAGQRFQDIDIRKLSNIQMNTDNSMKSEKNNKQMRKSREKCYKKEQNRNHGADEHNK